MEVDEVRERPLRVFRGALIGLAVVLPIYAAVWVAGRWLWHQAWSLL